MKKLQKVFAIVLVLSVIMSLMSVSALAAGSGKASDVQIVNEGGKNYYLASGEEASADNYDVWTSKTIAGTDTENEFEITLQVGSTVKTVPEDVAVLLLMDVSGSMLRDANGDYYAYYNSTRDYAPTPNPTRLDYAKDAAQDFVADLVKKAGNAQVQVSVVEFSNNAKTVLDWTDANQSGRVNSAVNAGIGSVDVGFSYGTTGEEASFYMERNTSFWDASAAKCTFVGCEDSDPAHTHAVSCWQEDHCVAADCEDTDPDHTHEVSFWEVTGACLYDDGTGSGCDNTDPAHKHVVGKCYYYSDACGCDNTDPTHTHERLRWDSDMANSLESYKTGEAYDRVLHRMQSGGTNMEGGLMLARNLLSKGLSDGGTIKGFKNVYVIMLSDGQPTCYVADADESTTAIDFIAGTGGGGTWSSWNDLEDIVSNGEEGDDAIVEDIKKMAGFNTILYCLDENQKLGYKGGSKRGNHELTEMAVGDWLIGTGKNCVGVDQLYNSRAIDGLSAAFGDLSERIEVAAKAWVVTDKMGENISFKAFTRSGEYASHDSGVITWNLGAMEPESGTGSVADPYLYTLKYTVRLDSAAADVIAADAVDTNEFASLSYMLCEADEDLNKMDTNTLQAKLKTAAFAKPAVKGLYGSYEFTKCVSGSGDALSGAGFTLYQGDKACSVEVVSGADGKVKFENIPCGNYQLVETTVPAGMQQMSALAFRVSYGQVTDISGNALPEVIYNNAADSKPTDPITPPSETYYTVTVNYIDKVSGEKVAESYVSAGIREGNGYDVTDKDAIEIDGYVYDSTAGDALSGIMDGNKVINVYYVVGTEELPDEDVPTTELPDEDVPTAEQPDSGEPDEELPEEDIPLADAPKTGDTTALWLAMALISGVGLAAVSILSGKKQGKRRA